jgi:hypothetical protein
MHDKKKTVTLAGERWEIRRMTPAVGSYIWQRLMAATYRMQVKNVGASGPEPSIEESVKMKELMEKAPPEQRIKTVCGVAFMELAFDELEFTQNAALRVISKLQTAGGAVDVPMPITQEDGRGMLPELEASPSLVQQLTIEALAFNLVSFLEPTASS